MNSSLSSYIASLTTLNGYFATWDYPKESCGYSGFISLVPSKPTTPLSPLEARMRRLALNLEDGHNVLPSLLQLIKLRAPLRLFKKYNIRKLANKHLYKSETMNHVVKLAEKIEQMQKEATPSNNIFLSGQIDVSATLDRLLKIEKDKDSGCSSAGSCSSGSTRASSPTSTTSDTDNVFLSGSIDVSSTLDRLLDFVKKSN